ncbi:tetratricopeptide repeat protein [Desulfococcaceae bacterium HSG8]|nr:tetratricopeptide repeat protein [Desulfococcaceae bacterium HSG8]
MRKLIIIGTLFFLFAQCFLFTACHSRKDKSLHEEPPPDENPAEQVTPKDLFDKGIEWAEKGDYEKALEFFNKVLEEDPEYTSAYYYRGHMWEEKGDLDKAISDYTRILEINPELVKAYHDRGTAWGKKGEYEKAIADLDKALEAEPNEAVLYDTRGNAWQMKGNYDRAINDYVRALELNPSLFVPYNNLAWLLATCSDPAYRSGNKALELAKRAVELNHDVSMLDTLAAAYAEAGKFDDAVETMKKIIRLAKESGKTEHLRIYTEHLESYKARKPWRVKK